MIKINKNNDVAKAMDDFKKSTQKQKKYSTAHHGLMLVQTKKTVRWIRRVQTQNGEQHRNLPEDINSQLASYRQAARFAKLDSMNQDEVNEISLPMLWQWFRQDQIDEKTWGAAYLEKIDQLFMNIVLPIFNLTAVSIDEQTINDRLYTAQKRYSDENIKKIRKVLLQVIDYFHPALLMKKVDRSVCVTPKRHKRIGALTQEIIERALPKMPPWFFDLFQLVKGSGLSPYQIRKLTIKDAEQLIDQLDSDETAKLIEALSDTAKARQVDHLFSSATQYTLPLPKGTMENGFKKLSKLCGLHISAFNIRIALQKGSQEA